MKDLTIKKIEAEVKGIETGLEVLDNNYRSQCLMSCASMELVERMEKRLNNIKEILKKESESI